MLPILLKLGPVTIYSYGLLLAIGFVVAAFIFWREARIRGMNEEKAIDVFILTTIICAIGARVGYVISNFSFFSADPGKIFLILKYPGLTIEGAALGGLLAVILVSFAESLSMWEVFDVIAISFLSASVLAFFGCFLDHCLVGPVFSPLILVALAIISLVILSYFQIKLRTLVSLSKFNKRPGAIFLSYLIFQSISFLILVHSVFYLIVLVVSVAIFALRYNELIRLWLNFLVASLHKLKTILKKGRGTSSTN